MNFKSKGLFISIIILISMMLICHTVNFLYPRNHNSNSFSNLELSIPNNTVPIEYNKIYYESDDNTEKRECKIKNEAEIPCKVIKPCHTTIPMTTTPMTTKYILSENEINLLYRNMYSDSGRQILLRTLSSQ